MIFQIFALHSSMLKSIQSNNSPGHSHNRLPSVVDLSTDSCPGILLKRNNKMNKPQVKIETFKKINGEIQIDYNGAYVGSLRTSPPWFKEDGIDTESIANLIESAPEMIEMLKAEREWMFKYVNSKDCPEHLRVKLPEWLKDDFRVRFNLLEIIIDKAEG